MTGRKIRPGPRRPIDPTRFTPHFRYGHGALVCEGVPVEEVARRVGTPVYLYSGAAVESNSARFDRAFAGIPHSICYAVKANGTLAVLRLLARRGSSFDIVSGGELERLRRAGVPGDRIVFSGVGKSREELRAALRVRILLFNVESQAELELLAEAAARIGRPAPAALRINPDIAAGGHPHIATGRHRHKFGLAWEQARRLYRREAASRWISWQGISAHIGSQITTLEPFRRTAARMAAQVKGLAADGIRLRFLDMGGGVGVRYTEERPIALEKYARLLIRILKPLGCHLLLEPGRAIAAPAGVLLSRVLYTKEVGGKRFVILDGAMNDLLRPALYGAQHAITPAQRVAGRGLRRADIVGPVCESGDCFLEDWPMREVRAGELAVIWTAGAYGAVLASNYNARPRPAEVLVEGRRWRVIRKRESAADLLRGER